MRPAGTTSSAIHRASGEKVVILIDEYDAPIHAGYVHGYAPAVLDFFRAFFTAGFKGNPHLYRGVLTGVLRVARASIFSGLNNLRVHSLLSPTLATAFGFTEDEVADLLTRAGLIDRLSEVEAWYNGYRVGGAVVYNPWSVMCYLDEAPRGILPQPYWLQTSSNELIKRVLTTHAGALQPSFEALLAGESIVRPVEENTVLDALEHDQDALWSWLVFAGYLQASQPERAGDGRDHYRLRIPNREVRMVYTASFRQWLAHGLGARGGDIDALTQAILRGDAAGFERQLQALALHILSYHDTARATAMAPSEPDTGAEASSSSPRPALAESLYHGFMLGLLAALEPDYRVRSNRESGRGRPDVMIAPRVPGRPGALLELKVARPGQRSLDAAAAIADGLAQIARHDYSAELRALGAEPIYAFAVAFDGKQVAVACGPEPATAASE